MNCELTIRDVERGEGVPTAPICRKKASEEGYMLVAVIFLLAILVLSLTVAIPRVKDDIQVDRDRETMHRGKQYARAIKLYYKKFGAYPPNVDALVMTNNIRFLRKKYTDPITGKDDWKPIMFGQNKTPMAMGFFGQPLAGVGTLIAGTGPGGMNGIAGASGLNGTSSGFGSTSGGAFGNNGSGSSFGGSGSSFGGNGSSFGGSGSNGSGSIFGTDNSGSNGSGNSGSNNNGANNSGTNQGTTSGTDSGNGSSSGAGGSGTGGTGSLSSNQTFGGGGIIGFEPGSDKVSILLYKKKNHYNEWEFLYSPLADRMMQGGNAGTIGQPIATPTGFGPGTGSGLFGNGANGGSGNGIGPGSGAGSGSGSGFGSSGSGSGSGTGSSPQQ
jgi:type II secretory pathway pseudopilin PulG